MAFELRDSLHCVIADGRALFLDLERDRYFALPPDLDACFRAVASGEAELCADERDRLMQLGVVFAREPENWAAGARIVCATRGYCPSTRASASGVTQALAAQLSAWLRLKFCGFNAALKSLALARAVMPRSGNPEHLDQVLAAFAASDVVVSFHDHCLFKSAALARSLWARGIAVDLVVGVQGRPFSAHCWVQWEDAVLNDTADAIAPFTPLLVV